MAKKKPATHSQYSHPFSTYHSCKQGLFKFETRENEARLVYSSKPSLPRIRRIANCSPMLTSENWRRGLERKNRREDLIGYSRVSKIWAIMLSTNLGSKTRDSMKRIRDYNRSDGKWKSSSSSSSSIFAYFPPVYIALPGPSISTDQSAQ